MWQRDMAPSDGLHQVESAVAAQLMVLGLH